MQKRVENAINIFLDALNNKTLVKGDCTKCAVGNLIREGCKYSNMEYNKDILPLEGDTIINWSMLFCTEYGIQKFHKDKIDRVLYIYPEVKKQFDSVDFTIEELAEIEKTFERNTKIYGCQYERFSEEEIRKDQIKGLEAVVKVMLGFSEKDRDISVYEVFTKKAELIPIQ
jgi:hypothetical protein